MRSRSEAAVKDLSSSLHEQPQGIWTARDAAERLSYPETGNDSCFQFEDASFWFVHRNRCIAALAARHHLSGPFLDIGGGNGFVSAGLERDGIATVLLEPGPKGALNGRTRGLSRVVCATLEQARFHDGAFASAGAFDVVEHIEDERPFLQSAARVLAPGGHFLVTVPAYSLLWSGEDDYAGHFRRYTLRSLRRSLEGAGLEWVGGTYIFAALVLPILLIRALPYRMGLAGKPAQDPAKDHESKGGLLAAALAPEVSAIRAGFRIPFGGSCLAIARKP